MFQNVPFTHLPSSVHLFILQQFSFTFSYEVIRTAVFKHNKGQQGWVVKVQKVNYSSGFCSASLYTSGVSLNKLGKPDIWNKRLGKIFYTVAPNDPPLHGR